MAKIDVYEDSKLATFISALGWLAIIFGSYSCFNEELGVSYGIPGLAAGFCLKILAFYVNRFVSKLKRKRREKKNAAKNNEAK